MSREKHRLIAEDLQSTFGDVKWSNRDADGTNVSCGTETVEYCNVDPHCPHTHSSLMYTNATWKDPVVTATLLLKKVPTSSSLITLTGVNRFSYFLVDTFYKKFATRECIIN